MTLKREFQKHLEGEMRRSCGRLVVGGKTVKEEDELLTTFKG